ncbi:MAG: DUF4492 domain-containing protein [Bacteroidales bacterium]
MKKLLNMIVKMSSGILIIIRNPSLARILILIVFIKFLVFYVFLKGFLYPKYLSPHYESDEQRSEQVIRDLVNTEKQSIYDRKH